MVYIRQYVFVSIDGSLSVVQGLACVLNAEQCQNGGACNEVDGTNLSCDCPSDTTGDFCEEGKFI